MTQVGLKLWSTNTETYATIAKCLYENGVFDYIELYIVPGTSETIPVWKTLGIPIALHAPHTLHGVNLALSEHFDCNKIAFREVQLFAKALDALYVVVHPGTAGNIEEIIRQLNILAPENLTIENKPPYTPLGEKILCRGSTVEEIKIILEQLHCKFCLDVGHAMCTGNFLGENPYSYLEKMYTLRPTVCHLSDNYIEDDLDKHLNFGHGNYDLQRIVSLIFPTERILIETKKNSSDNLLDFEKDAQILKGYYCG